MKYVILAIVALMVASCSSTGEGYTDVTDDIRRKLVYFDEHGMKLSEAPNSVLFMQVKHPGDTVLFNEVVLYCGRWNSMYDSLPSADSLWLRDIATIEEGQQVSYLLPYRNVRSTVIDRFSGNFAGEDDQVEIMVGVLGTFTDSEFLNFLTNQAQAGEISEREAIEFAFLNQRDSLDTYGDVTFRWFRRTNGAAPSSGEDITIRYGTRLLNGEVLDTLTEMSFTYGKPGQVVPGLHYAISKMKRGEVADVFMPSYQAFGELGSSTGLVPAFTPVVFRVQLADSTASFVGWPGYN